MNNGCVPGAPPTYNWWSNHTTRSNPYGKMDYDKKLFQAILEEPYDFTRRLIYADYLDDQGNVDRANFIRTQIAINNLPERCKRDDHRKPEFYFDCEDCKQLRLEEHSLLSSPATKLYDLDISYWVTWSSSFGKATVCRNLYEGETPSGYREILFRRGFVEVVGFQSTLYSEIGFRNWFVCNPILEAYFTDRRPELFEPVSQSDQNWRWWRFNSNGAAYQRVGLPSWIFNRLVYDRFSMNYPNDQDDIDPSVNDIQFLEYKSPESARTHVSNVLMDWGRKLAGLQPVDYPKHA